MSKNFPEPQSLQSKSAADQDRKYIKVRFNAYQRLRRVQRGNPGSFIDLGSLATAALELAFEQLPDPDRLIVDRARRKLVDELSNNSPCENVPCAAPASR